MEQAMGSAKDSLILQQQRWASQRCLAPVNRGYVPSVEANLFRPLSPAAQRAFASADGSELEDTMRRPAKMRALHSSSALAANVFDYWTGADLTPLFDAIGLESNPVSLEFEGRFPTGLPGIPPNLDVVLRCQDGTMIGIESKFSEWLTPKHQVNGGLKDKYFQNGATMWTNVGMPNVQKLAESLRTGGDRFRFLDVSQLLKHALGLALAGPQFALHYLFYDSPGPESVDHRKELARFEGIIGRDLKFRWMSYQDLFRRLSARADTDHLIYLDYLRRRYFPPMA